MLQKFLSFKKSNLPVSFNNVVFKTTFLQSDLRQTNHINLPGTSGGAVASGGMWALCRSVMDAACNGTLGPKPRQAGEAQHLAAEPQRSSGTLASQGQFSVCAPPTHHLFSVYVPRPCTCSLSTSHHLSPALTIGPDQARGSCLVNNDLLEMQKNIKNYRRLLSLLPAGTNHSRIIALTRKNDHTVESLLKR